MARMLNEASKRDGIKSSLGSTKGSHFNSTIHIAVLVDFNSLPNGVFSLEKHVIALFEVPY